MKIEYKLISRYANRTASYDYQDANAVFFAL